MPAGSGLSLSSEVKGILTSSVPCVCHKTHRKRYEVFKLHTNQGLQNEPCPLAMSTTLFAAGEPAEGSGGCRGHDGCDKGDVIPELLRPGRIPQTQGLPGDRDVLPNGTGVEWQGSGWVSGS